MRKIDTIIIHCSATRPSWGEGVKLAEQLAEIRRWHVQERGWSDIGYHYIIGRCGNLLPGRPLARVGAHVRGHNKNSIGIALIGGHGASAQDNFCDHFTDAQERRLLGLLVYLMKEYPDTPINGHNCYAAKACPGFRVDKWLEEYHV